MTIEQAGLFAGGLTIAFALGALAETFCTPAKGTSEPAASKENEKGG